MKEVNCIICGATTKEVEHMIGVEYNHLDHDCKVDVGLCDECIMEAHELLEDKIWKEKVRKEFNKLWGSVLGKN